MRTELRTKEEKYEVYIANDGTIFSTEQKCKEYEESLEGLYNARFMAIAKRIRNGYRYVDPLVDSDRSESDFYLVEPKDDSQINTIIAYIKNHDGSLKPSDSHVGIEDIKIGTKYIVSVNEYWSCISSLESIKKYWNEQLEGIVKVFDGSLDEAKTE